MDSEGVWPSESKLSRIQKTSERTTPTPRRVPVPHRGPGRDAGRNQGCALEPRTVAAGAGRYPSYGDARLDAERAAVAYPRPDAASRASGSSDPKAACQLWKGVDHAGVHCLARKVDVLPKLPSLTVTGPQCICHETAP